LSLPTGTVTFLFTDIEGSTQLMQELGDRYVQAQVDHHAILRAAFTSNSGRELRTEGDSFFCVFQSALDACDAAAAAQRDFAKHEWTDGVALRVRMGLHTGEAPLVGNEYIGIDVHHAARVSAAAHGGQVLLSEATSALVESALPAGLGVRDLGLHRLKDLARPERLFQLVIDGTPQTFPALRTLDSTPNNLPTQLTSFVGREELAREARRLLQQTRLLTLTGPGGIGKTRLSLQVAADVVQLFPGGVYFVALSAVRDPELVPSAIAQAIGLSVAGNRLPFDAVVDELKDKRVLLVLDNLEQLLPQTAPIIAQLLHSTSDLKIVASSRAALHVYGEQEVALEPLRLPDLKSLPSLEALSQYEAVKLFIERAMAAKHDFQVTNENAPAIAGICERVDGLPLAIELAAARVKLFNPNALLSRLASSANVLGSGSRDLPGRQQTLRGAIAWSYDMLEPNLQKLFARFSVFARGATLEQAEEVCGPGSEIGVDVLEGLDELADQSLLRRLPDLDEPRLLMLQVIREFAAERLEEGGEARTIRDRHAAAYQKLAEEASPHLFGAQQKEWLDRLEIDHDNIRAAFDWSIASGDARQALRLGAAFWRFWQMRGHLREGRARLDAVLAMPGAREHPDERVRAMEAVGGIAYWQGDMPAAQVQYDELLAIARAGTDRRTLANALYNATFSRTVNSQELEESAVLLHEALAIYRELDDASGIAQLLWAVGNSYYFRGLDAQAIAPLDEAIERNRALGQRFGLAWALHTRTLVAIDLKDFELADSLWREGIQIFFESGDVSGLVLLLSDAAEVAHGRGDDVRGMTLAGAADAYGRRIGTQLNTIVLINQNRAWYLRDRSPEEQRAWGEGQAMTVDQAVAFALSGQGREESVSA
jgi:predicted ATPase/class 3 adenylate cyclase